MPLSNLSAALHLVPSNHPGKKEHGKPRFKNKHFFLIPNNLSPPQPENCVPDCQAEVTRTVIQLGSCFGVVELIVAGKGVERIFCI